MEGIAGGASGMLFSSLARDSVSLKNVSLLRRRSISSLGTLSSTE